MYTVQRCYQFAQARLKHGWKCEVLFRASLDSFSSLQLVGMYFGTKATGSASRIFPNGFRLWSPRERPNTHCKLLLGSATGRRSYPRVLLSMLGAADCCHVDSG